VVPRFLPGLIGAQWPLAGIDGIFVAAHYKLFSFFRKSPGCCAAGFVFSRGLAASDGSAERSASFESCWSITMAASMRLIKKYPNRRLYDTRSSSYITLVEVRELVLKQEDFQVIDAKSGEDLTRSILLQIILEQEGNGSPMFSCEVLTQFIRCYGSAMQTMMGDYLQRNAEAFAEIQKSFQQQSRALSGDSLKPADDLSAQFLSFQSPAMQSMMATCMAQSKGMLDQMQQNMQRHTDSMFGAFPGSELNPPPVAVEALKPESIPADAPHTHPAR
jgi:polyhydroxyalkanoate synthesis repressor PhaR